MVMSCCALTLAQSDFARASRLTGDEAISGGEVDQLRVDFERTPRLFAEFARFEPSEQAEIISVLQHMHSNRGGFNDAIAAVRGREGGNTVAPKSWARL